MHEFIDISARSGEENWIQILETHNACRFFIAKHSSC